MARPGSLTGAALMHASPLRRTQARSDDKTQHRRRQHNNDNNHDNTNATTPARARATPPTAHQLHGGIADSRHDAAHAARAQPTRVHTLLRIDAHAAGTLKMARAEGGWSTRNARARGRHTSGQLSA
jgi:hypothetical protein